MKSFLLLICLCILNACGVKAPPLAPNRPPEVKAPNLDCSVYDPTCDKKDPKYDPAKDPAKQAKTPADTE